MTDDQKEAGGDQDWLDLFNRTLDEAGHGSRKQLADALNVDASMVTRMGQGGPVSTGHLYRASVILGIRPPTTIPLDALQQRVLGALVRARLVLSPAQSGALVAGFEAKVNRIVDAYRAFTGELSGPKKAEDLDDQINELAATIEDEVGLPEGSADFVKIHAPPRDPSTSEPNVAVFPLKLHPSRMKRRKK